MRVFSIRLEETSIVLFIMIVICGMVYTWKQEQAVTAMMPTTAKTIVIDAGHGGWDPGKTGIRGENEKDINLKIASKLQLYLEQSGATVIVTRNEDLALSNKKREDMKERKVIANESKADLLISIHQNSFPKPSVHGAQVFYYNDSEESKNLAEILQASLKDHLDKSNNRVAKANKEYYILKNTKLPGVIIECGFLTNYEEEKILNTEEYQEKVAWAIYMGLIDYFKSLEETAV